MTLASLGRPAARLALLLLPLAGACSSWQRVGGSGTPSPDQQLLQLFDPAAMYTRLGRIVSADQVPFIGQAVFVPGHGDSTQAIVSLSIANRAFAFQREGNAYQARYRVEYQFDRTGTPSRTVTRTEAIRVASFQETMRTDESVLLQQVVNLVPGDYTITVRVRDLANSQVGTGVQKVTAPAFTAGTVTAPILAYQVRGRASRNDSLPIVLNPRGTLSYGGDTLLIYFEGVGFTRPTDVPIQVRDERDNVVLRQTAHFTGERAVEGKVIRIAPDSAPLGQLEVLVGDDANIRRTNAIVSFSTSWVVTNFDDLLELLRYFGYNNRITQMKQAGAGDRAQLWRDFFHATDPNPATPENEALQNYFARLAYANTRFRDEGIAGWRTDRGEVFIVLGEPDENYDSSLQTTARFVQWTYNDHRLLLTFQDQTGFGRFRLTAQSRQDYEIVRMRVMRNKS